MTETIKVARIKAGQTFIGELQETGDTYAKFETVDKQLVRLALPLEVIDELGYSTYQIFKITHDGNNEFTVTMLDEWPKSEPSKE